MSLLRLRFQADANGIDAVPKVGGGRAVGKDMTYVRATGTAADFGADHAVRHIPNFLHDVFGYRIKIAGPSASGIKLCIRTEQRSIATNTMVDAVVLRIRIFSGEGGLGAAFHTDPELLRGQFGFPISTAVRIVGVNSGKVCHTNIMRRSTEMASREKELNVSPEMFRSHRRFYCVVPAFKLRACSGCGEIHFRMLLFL
jgi:hypothetical protein